jgi:hypothetical protein
VLKLLPLTLFTIAALAAASLAVAEPASALKGTFASTISGKAPPLDGKWTLRLLPGTKFQTLRNGKVVVSGSGARTSTRITFTDAAGPYACAGTQKTGVYSWKLTGKVLTLKPVRDSCGGRRTILTSRLTRT